MPELVVFVGIPASGKSTLYHRTFAQTHAVVSKDLMGRSRSLSKQERQMRDIDELLSAGKSVVVDNMNATVIDRKPLIVAAHARGARAICFFFEPDPTGAVVRNAKRDGSARVPDKVIDMTMHRLRRPFADEGFDEIYAVKLDGKGGFDIRPYDG